MKSPFFYLVVLSLCCFVRPSHGQDTLQEDFSSEPYALTLNFNANYSGAVSNEEVVVTANGAGPNYEAFTITFPTMNLSDFPYMSMRIKSSEDVSVRIDVEDVNDKASNGSPVIEVINNRDYKEFIFNYTGRFNQSWPVNDAVDPEQINTLVVFANPGSSAFSGTITFDDIKIGGAVELPVPPYLAETFVNQIGYYPTGKKLGIVKDTTIDEFYIQDVNSSDTVFTGTLGEAEEWEPAGNKFRIADFSDLTTEGAYRLLVPGFEPSYTFDISHAVHEVVGKAGLKSYYYQRCTQEITSEFGGQWSRQLGHPDDQVEVHTSAASDARPAGTIISSPRGWYDAGDYNKYIVNSGISTYTLLALYEHYSSYFDTVEVDIPESGNNIPDLLEEALWNVRWMLTMQDPNDGGVYHKLSSKQFTNGLMPHEDNTTRYVVMKTTAATLDFSAVMAQSYRIFSNFETEFPGLADSCLLAAQISWNWARINDNVAYSQPSDFGTGQYGDNTFSDEFNWAAAELYVATGLDSFYVAMNKSAGMGTPGWQDVGGLPWLTLAHYSEAIDPGNTSLTTFLQNKLISYANTLRSEYQSSAFGVVMGAEDWNFTWGSNGVVGNQAMILLQAFNLTQDTTYLDAALSNLDYLLGRNATGYSFLTGYGELHSEHIHHRISELDGVSPSVPGLIAGGPNPGQQDIGAQSWSCKSYVSDLPALSYLDHTCSYASNEVTINWNAPFVYSALAIEAIYNGASSEVKDFDVGTLCTSGCVIGLEEMVLDERIVQVYPNPTQGEFKIVVPTDMQLQAIMVTDVSGRNVEVHQIAEKEFVLPASLNLGTYTIIIQTDQGVAQRLIFKN